MNAITGACLLLRVTNSDSEKDTAIGVGWGDGGWGGVGEGLVSCFRHLKILMDDYNLFRTVTH